VVDHKGCPHNGSDKDREWVGCTGRGGAVP